MDLFNRIYDKPCNIKKEITSYITNVLHYKECCVLHSNDPNNMENYNDRIPYKYVLCVSRMFKKKRKKKFNTNLIYLLGKCIRNRDFDYKKISFNLTYIVIKLNVNNVSPWDIITIMKYKLLDPNPKRLRNLLSSYDGEDCEDEDGDYSPILKINDGVMSTSFLSSEDADDILFKMWKDIVIYEGTYKLLRIYRDKRDLARFKKNLTVTDITINKIIEILEEDDCRDDFVGMYSLYNSTLVFVFD